MKKGKLIITILAMSVMLTACNGISKSKKDEKTTEANKTTAAEQTVTDEKNADSEKTEEVTSTQEASTEESSEESTEADSKKVGITEEELAVLVNENFNCARNIFGMSPLPTVGDPLDGGSLYQVDPEEYASYEELYNYVNSVYCKEYTDSLFDMETYDGAKRYYNEDGKLYTNVNAFGAKGYYVDWSGCFISITTNSETECKFTVTGSIEEPSAEPVKEPYTIEGRAFVENGKWVLENMIY